MEVFLRQDSIEIAVEVKSVWKTGVEMESLTGASAQEVSQLFMIC